MKAFFENLFLFGILFSLLSNIYCDYCTVVLCEFVSLYIYLKCFGDVYRRNIIIDVKVMSYETMVYMLAFSTTYEINKSFCWAIKHYSTKPCHKRQTLVASNCFHVCISPFHPVLRYHKSGWILNLLQRIIKLKFIHLFLFTHFTTCLFSWTLA